jgi:hypothetical protein
MRKIRITLGLAVSALLLLGVAPGVDPPGPSRYGWRT